MQKISRSEELKEAYNLEKHQEGGWFSEVYTSTEEKNGRHLAGSIYFLLDKGEVSHFHQIDCDEIWYYHEGCGMKITVLGETDEKEYFLGADVEKGERHMAVIPKGSIFAAENLRKDSFTLVSCVTSPKFMYDGFRLLDKKEIKEKFPDVSDNIIHLAY